MVVPVGAARQVETGGGGWVGRGAADSWALSAVGSRSGHRTAIAPEPAQCRFSGEVRFSESVARGTAPTRWRAQWTQVVPAGFDGDQMIY